MEWNLAINRNRFIRAGNSEAVGRIRVQLARPARAIPFVPDRTPFAAFREKKFLLRERVRACSLACASLRERNTENSLLHPPPPLLLLVLLPCRCYARSPPSLPAPRFFHSRTLSPEAKEARVPLRLTFSGMNYFARRVAFVKIRLLDSSNQSPAVYVASSDATDQLLPLLSSSLPVKIPPPISRPMRGERRKEGRKVFTKFFCYSFFQTALICRRSETMEFDRSTVAYDSRRMRAQPGRAALRKIPKAYPHERGLLKETCACLVLLPLQLMSTHSQLIRTVCIDYCIPLVAPRIGFTVKARPNEPPCRKKPELDVPIRPPELWILDVFSSFVRRLRVRRNKGRGNRSVLFTPV